MFRKQIVTLLSLLFGFIFVFQVSGLNAQNLVELQTRRGLSHTQTQISTKRNITIGFFGGSITEAEKGWRSRTMQWFRTQYPAITFREVNAAIGGTNSKYGAFRLQKHLLDSATFDLIFLEFSVNDLTITKTDTLACYRSMEGIIRHIRKNQPKTDICLVYTISEPAFEAAKQAKLTLSAAIHERLAAHYNLPTVYFGNEVLSKINSGEAVFKDKITDLQTGKNANGKYVFATDGVHPGNYGHGIYESVMKRVLPGLLGMNKNAESRKLPNAIVASNYENAALQQVNPKLANGMQLVQKNNIPDSLAFLEPVLKSNRNYLVSNNPVQTYNFSFIGTEIGISCIYGMYTANVVIEVDGIPYEYPAFDKYCTFNRHNFIFHSCAPGKHEVRIYAGKPLTVEQKKQIIGAENFKENPFYSKNYLIFSDVLTANNRMEQGIWNGAKQYSFDLANRKAIVVVPNKPLKGNPWIVRPAFFDAFAYADSALINEGYHVCYYDVTHEYGSPAAQKLFSEFYDFIVKKFRLSKKAVLEGFSRGGLFCLNWAVNNPEKVACIYLDAPVCNVNSWPRRFEAERWEQLLKLYNTDEVNVDALRISPVDKAKEIAATRIPILIVAGDADRLVPYNDNAGLLLERMKPYKPNVQLILKPGVDHHPHSLSNPAPIIQFIKKYTKN